MGRIQSNVGLTTGIDIQKTVEQLMAVSARPRDALQVRIKGLQAQQVVLNELTALVVGVQLQSDRIGNASNISTVAVASSKTDVITATVSGTPLAGNYPVQSIQTAQTATAASSPLGNAADTVQSGELVVRTGGFVDNSQSLDDLRGGLGVARGIIRITDRSGQSKEVDLRYASNMDETIQAINNSGLRISARTNGDKIVLNDLSGSTLSNLIVEEVGGGRTADDLGLAGVNVALNTATGEDLAYLSPSTRLGTLRDNRGLTFQTGKDLTVTLRDGTSLEIDANATRSPTNVGQLLTSINAVDSNKFEIKVATNGDGFEIIDKTIGSGTFSATGALADQLGFTGVAESGGKIQGARVQNVLQGPLLSSLNGGKGIGTPGKLSITNRNTVTTQVDLAGSTSLRDVIDKINASSAGVTASLNRSRTGLVLQDVTGATAGNLIVANGDSNNSATKLGIVADVGQNSIDSKSLKLQYIHESTEIGKLNQGRGVRLGTFTITNAAGLSKTISLSSSTTKTVGDVLTAINNNAIGVTARLNDDGDGIAISDSSFGSGDFSITDDQSGNAALDLGIRGKGTNQTNPNRKEINGSQTFRLSFTASDAISQVVQKINDSNGPVSASILTSGTNNVRVLFTSRTSGEAGRIHADGDSIGININNTGSGRDAIISVGGSSDSGGTLVKSSTNTISNAIDGVVLTVKGTSTESIDIGVSTNNSTLERNLQLFVDQYNKVRDKIKKETEFNTETKTTGLLIGSSEVLRVEQSLSRFINQRSFASGSVQSLQQLGISLDDTGKLSLDKDKLSKAIQRNAGDVKDFLTKEKTGFGARAKVLLESLVGIKNSTLVNRTQALNRQIESSTDRLANVNGRLDRERERLLKQFYDLENSITKIRNNGSSLNQIQNLFTTA
ncbi:MAG: flagellar filament capping protein FliD [Pirellula sp.]|jgi:flagellar hook-associated protein 2|nr:flagellar filament capping protein FliD [Pirellula sp.]